MPGPDPDALWIEKDGDRTIACFQAYFGTGNYGNRRRRAEAMVQRVARGDWRCSWCGDPLPDWRRVDTQYCCEGCRKRAARQRRAHVAALRQHRAKLAIDFGKI